MAGRVAVGNVTQEFVDGGFYVKGKLEEVARGILQSAYAAEEERKKADEATEKVSLKEEDVKYLMDELEISRTEAEVKLRAKGGDLLNTVQTLVGQPGSS